MIVSILKHMILIPTDIIKLTEAINTEGQTFDLRWFLEVPSNSPGLFSMAHTEARVPVQRYYDLKLTMQKAQG